ncbi:hemicentin-1-like isoform X2 [Acropora muricata]|uniref:hemicentin-1-like isoform X2 n=1 Tax=Acropora muricata TaxID=159855 RepID=UPI0034E5415A
MIAFLRFSSLLFLFFLVAETESQLFNIISQPSSPVTVLEGQRLRLNWTFSVQRTFRRVQLSFSGKAVAFLEKTLTSLTLSTKFNDRLLASATETNATITFLSVNKSDSNDYIFAILDTDGDSVEAPFEVVVQYPPSFKTRAPDQAVLEGGPAINLNCTADGEPTPSITWTKVFANGSDSDVLFTGEQFILPSNRTSDGTYRCKASNGIGNDVNHTVNVVVNFKPEITFTVKSSNDSICRGDTINITCSAVGKPAVHTYQLFKDGTQVHTSNNSVLFWRQITTARGETVYTCLANNTVAVANTTKAITVGVPSSIQSILDKVVTEGDNVSLTCNASGVPTQVSWINVRSGNRTNKKVLELKNISRHEAGEYRCDVRNPCRNATESATIEVQFKPEMVQLVTRETTVCQGDIISFNCTANSNPAIHTYQLYVNGTMVNEASSTGVWNRTMTTGGVFVYKCMVNNTIGTAMSMDVFVTVNVPSSIQSIPDKVVTEGDDLTLICNASGIPTQVSWINVRFGNRTHGNVLEIKNVSRHEAGEYRCEARNPCRNATESATVDVQFKPEMVQLVTRERTVCQGDIITFNCTANSNPAVHTYQLHVNGTMVNETSSTGVWNKTMTTGGMFVYKCMVINTIGTAMSMDVFVTVNVPSSIQSIPDKVVTDGDNMTLICNASGIPEPVVSWINVRSGNRTHGNVLEFENVSRHEAGEYRCEARNPCRNATESATIDVQFEPEMVQLVTGERTVCQGDIITFNCTANSNPAVHTYRLYMNETMVSESSTGVWNRTVRTGGVLVYKCMVNNTIGTAMSMDVSVTVNVPSSIQSIPDKVVTEGDNVTLICNASGIPEPVVSWINLRSGNRTHGNVLEFENVSRHEAGEYRCEARNPCRNATESPTIDVQYEPEMVQLVTGERTVCQGDIITFNCTANSNPAVHTYRLYMNGTMVSESSTGVWNRTVTTGGVLVYKCMVNNTIGTAMSVDVFVTVNVPSSIQSIPDKVVREGDNVTLICNASGIPEPVVSWINVRSGNRTHGNVLEFENVSRHEAGEHRCEARNPCRNATESTTIDVQYAPKITHISAPQTLNRGEMLTLNCAADGNPAPNITWTRLSTGNIVNMPLTVTGKEYEGGYRCTASNRIGTVFEDTSITVNLPAVAVALADKNIVEKGGNATLFCSVSGTPTPSVIWIHVDTGNKHYDETWFISDITFNDLGEYRCDAINRYGNDTNSTAIFFKGGKCEEVCKDGRTCRSVLRTIPLCLCEEGKTGEKCEKNESTKDFFEAGLEFPTEFKDVYNNLENPETKTFTDKIEAAVKDELSDTGLTQVRVVRLRRGSVIADLELRFNRSIYQDSLRELLQDATKDNKLGDLKVKNVVVGGFFSTVESPTVKGVESCSMFFVGEKCDRASAALIALIVVGVIVVVGLLIGIVVCSLHKKNASGRGSFQNVKVSQRQDPEGNGSLPRDFVEPGGSRETLQGTDNTGYDPERPPESTQMVTFNSNNGQVEGIHLKDSRSQQT